MGGHADYLLGINHLWALTFHILDHFLHEDLFILLDLLLGPCVLFVIANRIFFLCRGITYITKFINLQCTVQ